MPIIKFFNGKFLIFGWLENDRCPVLEFLQDLKRDGAIDYRKMVARLKLLADNGAPSNEEQCKKLEDDIWELKAGDGIRILWFYERERLIICTHGFRKKFQKTPPGEIEKARSILQKYRQEGGV